MLYAVQEFAQLVGIEDRLRDGILRPGLHLVLETFDLFVKVNRAGVDADANAEGRRLSNRVVAEVETVIQLVDHVRQADGVYVEDGGGVRIWPHLRRGAGGE